jgi:oligopeptide transport system ATP-binding protein
MRIRLRSGGDGRGVESIREDTYDAHAPLLEVEALSVAFPSVNGPLYAVDGASFTVRAGEAVGIVGESGSGKTVTTRAVLGLIDPRHRVAGSIRFRGRELTEMRESGWQRLRGRELALIPQNALAALNPLFSVGWQIAELYRVHAGASRRDARLRSVASMERVGIPAAARRFDSYPHEFSGGMRQRAMIAMAVALNPRLVIADEPTTALDVTIEAEVMDLLDALRRDGGMSLIHITHDVGLAASSVDRLIVMYAGRIVEEGPVSDVYGRPAHPYTRALLESRPALGSGRSRRLPSIPGTPPKLSAVPSGCPFHPRCAFRRERCDTERPLLRVVGAGRAAACHYAEEVLALGGVGQLVDTATRRG